MYAYLKARSEGCALLALACVLLMGWMRSLVLIDEYVRYSDFSDTRSKTGFYRSSDGSIRYMWRLRTQGNVQENQAWSVHYAVLMIPVTVAAGYLILWPRRKPLPFSELIAIIIIAIVLALAIL